ncbi:MAG TPA: recombinase family protein [Burkholderiales bacterium]
MRAAIYARKSTDDNDRHADNKSVTRQIDRAHAYAKAKGWTVDEAHVFVDDGVSGAEYTRRPGLVRLLTAVERRPRPFDVLVASEQSRIGRDMVRNSKAIDEIRSAGVRIFYYLNDSEEKFDTPEQRLMSTLSGFAAEMERAKNAERTRDALTRKAEKGHSAGGRCYGYDLVPVYGANAQGERVREYTDFKINEEQAEIVRGIFRAYADGNGYGAIAKALNGDPEYAERLARYFKRRTPAAPQHGAQGTGSWCPTAVRAMLYRTRYIGKLQYGEYRNVRSAGRAGKCVKQDKFIIVERPDLAIVPADLWERVQARLKATRAAYVRANEGKAVGRPETGRASKFLLSGLARCGCKTRGRPCGGNIVVTGGQRQKHWYYVCSYHQNRGAQVCANDVRERMAVMDELVLGKIESVILTPDALEYVIEQGVRKFKARRRERPEGLPKLEAEIRRLTRELERLTQAIALGRAPQTVLDAIAERERRIEALRREAAGYRRFSELTELDLRRTQRRARERMRQFKDLIRSSDVPKARDALRLLLRDREGQFAPLTFDPVERAGRRTFAVRGVINAAPVLYNDGTEERT